MPDFTADSPNVTMCDRAWCPAEVAPYLRGGGVGQQVVLEGNRLVLTCLAGGSWPLQYRWTLNNSYISDWTPQYRLPLPSVSRAVAGLYQCVVRNRMGTLLSKKTDVHVAFLGEFAEEEQRRTVTQGRAAVVSPPPLASYPAPLVTWYRDGHKIIPSDRIAISLDNQLVVLATTTADAGRYHVEAVNELTGENATSPAVSLSVSESDTELVSPAIVIGPKNTTAVAGRELTLECIANARPVDRLALSWKREGRWLASGRRLVIPAPVLADSGWYVCEAALTNSTSRPVEARAHLTVMELPSFTSQPKRKTLAELDKNVDIPCLVTGTPQPRVEWFKDAVPLSKLANPRYKVAAATGLTVRRVQPEDGGIFQCVARNAAGEAEAHTHLQVSSVAPAFIFPPTYQAVTEGNAALFTCQVSGAPKPAIVWRKGSQVLASGSVQTPRFFLLESGGLQVQPVGFQDSGEYTCIASNPQGSINVTAGLTVWSRTLISVPPSDQRVIKGTTATLDCNAQHDPRVEISFQWHRSGVLVRPSSGGRVSVRQGSLTIGQTWSGDIGDYTCAVTSRAGNDSRSARLEVIELPHSPRSLAAQLNDSDSRSVHLSWLRPFDGNSPLLHYLLELSENSKCPWLLLRVDLAGQQTGICAWPPFPAREEQCVCVCVCVCVCLFAREETPSVAPQSISVSAVSPSILALTWDTPPPETQNGLIQGYKIHYWERERQNETETVMVVFTPDTSTLLANLTSYTHYMLTLTAFNTAGDGPPSEPRGARTQQSAPSPPAFLTFSEVSGTSLNASWGTPPSPNGQLEGYRVVYQPTTPVQGVSKVVTVEVKGSWHRWLKVQDLTRGVTYTFSVQARTVSLGPPLHANITAQPLQGTPGSPMGMSITKSSSALALHWSEGEAGAGPISGYVVEARPSDEGVWDSFIRLLPPSSRSVSVPMERLRSGISYEFRVIAINRYGYGEPSSPSTALAALSERPFYEEWWFLLVMALISLILIMVLVFTLLLHGHGTKYRACSTGKHLSTVEESVTLDNGGFTALELNSRTLNSKSSFLKKNGTRSPPRPSPGGLHYSDEDICNNYNGAILTESTTLTEKPTEVSESELTDSDYEDEQPKHSFVNHYMSDPTYYNSWKRQPKGLKGTPAIAGPFAYEECVVAAAAVAAAAGTDGEPYYQTVVTQHSAGGAYTPTGQPALTHVNPGTNPPGSRTPLTGFSSFV
ncbi:unnamed protein product [Merluccius merluccius]